MLTKNYSPKGKKCKVTFRLPAEVNAATAQVLGDFNDWNAEATPMKKLKDGSFSAQVSLDAGKSYHFRYLVDEGRWVNAREADGFEANPFGTENAVINL